MHQLTDKKNIILTYAIFLLLLSTISNKSLEIKKDYNISINEINVSGLSKNYNLLIEDNLNQLLFKNIFFIDEDNIRKIMSKYNLIESYSIKKIYPKRIDIQIKQTKFIAKISGTNIFIIGSNGKIIRNEDQKINKLLPLFVGKLNSEKFLEFKQFIETSSFKVTDFKSIVYHPSDRWDVLTIKNVLIKLPKKNLNIALETAYNIHKDIRFKDNTVIDLRIAKHIIIE
jgi:cell division protein FtsQ